jgi:hypothetical protein
MTDRYSYVDFEEDEDTNIYCPMCEKLGFTAIMGPKLILEGQQREPDHDSFLQCPSCGWLCPIHEVGPEPEIQDTAQTIESPYDNQEGIVMGVANRQTQRKKKAVSSNRVTRTTSKRRAHKIQESDPEIEELKRRYGDDNVKVHYDSTS